MLNKKKQELTTEDAPDSILPWEMLEDAEIITISARIKSRNPDLYLTAFARRVDNKIRACFDKGPEGTGKSVVLIDEAAPAGKQVVKHYPRFSEWFDAALKDAE